MLRPLLASTKATLKRALYAFGPLRAYHRLRNRRRLTVVMFHRVMSPDDPRWRYCDPEYTVADTLLAQCVEFFKRHYNVVSLPQLLDPGADLGARPLLITFDDGWEDNERYALPVLRRAGVPAVVFVAGDAVDADQPDAFWEVWLVHAYRRGALTPDRCRELWQLIDDPVPPPAFTTIEHCRDLIARLERLDEDALARVMRPLAAELASPSGDRHLLTSEQLRKLPAGNVEIGAHGRSHFPLARARDPLGDMRGARDVLAQKLGVDAAQAPATMSFPHGSYTPDTVRLAHDAGYRLVFTSDPVLNEIAPGAPPPPILGRLGIEPELVTDAAGRFRPELLALRLFRARATVLTGVRIRTHAS